MTSTIEDRDRTSDIRAPVRSPFDLALVSAYLVVLATLLAGYMFLGRGFAHLGRSPIYVGEVVLVIGVVTAAVAFARLRPRRPLLPVIWLLLGFMALGFARTIPYLGVYGVDALRDGVLWGYAVFALMIYVLADRAVALGTLTVYGRVVPVFAFWLPISFNIFVILSSSIQADQLGSNVPIVVFKSGDMAVHIVGSLAFLVLGAGEIRRLRTIVWRVAITVPLLWAALVAGAINRGGLVTVVAGMATIAALAFVMKRSRNWVPVLAAPVVFAMVLGTTGLLTQLGVGAAATTPEPRATASSTPASATASPTTSPPDASPTVAPAVCEPAPRSLVANPGFELDAGNDSRILGWTTWVGSYNIVDGGGYHSNNFASIRNTDGPWTATMTSTTFAVEAGQRIAVSLRAKALEGSPVVATYVNWYDGAGSRISSVYMFALETDGEAAWQEGGGLLTAPEGAARADVQLFETAGNVAIGIDDVIVKSATTTCEIAPASRSLIANPGFELGTLDDSTIEGWTTSGGLYGIVGGGGHRGENYASVQNTGEAWAASITSSKFPFQAGHAVFVSLWAKAIEGRPVVAAYVNWYDSADALISNQFMTDLATGGRADWQESAGILVAPEGTTHAAIQLWERTGYVAAGIDEVIVRSGRLARPGDVVTPGGVLVPGADPGGRPATIDQIFENLTSIFSSSKDDSLEGTKAFRLKWWGSIIDYTVFGEYFWTGKGFGVNLADDDGFQVNADGSLRSPHNSHITTLARMGVPGLVLWILLQGAFGVGLLRSVLSHRRVGDMSVATVGAWILAYWIAMMVNTSFDPYLEGPQGGIWFWCVFGLGLVVMRLDHTRAEA